jgi:hypothetical protein
MVQRRAGLRTPCSNSTAGTLDCSTECTKLPPAVAPALVRATCWCGLQAVVLTCLSPAQICRCCSGHLLLLSCSHGHAVPYSG